MLDELFLWEENKEQNISLVDDTLDIKWKAFENESKHQSLKPKLFLEYVNEYIIVSAHKSGLTNNFSIENLKHTLEEFTLKSSIESMQTSEGILKSFEIWKIHEELSSIKMEIRKIHFTWIKDFVSYLSEKRVVGEMPTFKHYLSSLKKNFFLNITNPNIIFNTVNVLFYSAIFILFSVHGRWLPPLDLQFPGFELLDEGFFLGFLKKGIITAPIFVILFLSKATLSISRLLLPIIFAFCFSFFTLMPNNLIGYLKCLSMTGILVFCNIQTR